MEKYLSKEWRSTSARDGEVPQQGGRSASARGHSVAYVET